jgi:hypothetical protein
MTWYKAEIAVSTHHLTFLELLLKFLLVPAIWDLDPCLASFNAEQCRKYIAMMQRKPKTVRML